jgi:hypothetical protein
MLYQRKVESSAISAVLYDTDTKVLSITFKQGRTYDYFDVPRKEVDNLVKAPSVGKYFNAHIKRYSIGG